MKIISNSSILAAKICPLDCYEWACDVILQKKEMLLPPKISLKPRDGVFYNTMPVLIPNSNLGGVKVVSRYPERIPSLDSQILLYNLQSGECIALLDGNWITAMRTGAVAAHTMKLFAKSDFESIGYIGLGNVARASLQIFLNLYPNRDIKVKLKKYKNQHELFSTRFENYENIHFEYVDNYEDVIKGTDIVVEAATYLKNDICDINCVDKGTLIVPIHTRGFTQFDYLFDRIYGDDMEHIRGFKNFEKYECFAEVTDVLRGKALGRQNDNERIIVYNIGIAAQDVYFAGKIYNLIGSDCIDISLNPPIDKFWI